MQFAEKDFSYYWKVIKVPVIVLISWSIVAIVVAKLSMYWYQSIFSGWAGFIFQIAIFSFVGYAMVAENKGQIKNSAWAGALTGILAGSAGAILSIITINYVPELIEQSVRQAVAQGVPEATVRQMIKVGMYIGLVTGPLITGLLGALISGISGLVTKKTIKEAK